MTRTSKALKRLGVAGLAVVTIGAGVPALIASSAQAAANDPTTIYINPPTATGTPGTCLNYVVSAYDSLGNPAVNATITATLTPQAATPPVDVDFCTTAQTPEPASNLFGGAPGPVGPAPSTPSNVTNGGAGAADSGTFKTDGNGQVTFGAFSNQSGSVDIRAFFDVNGNGTFNNGEPQSTGTANFGQGGASGTNAQADVVRCVDATPETDTNVVGETHTFKARLTNNSALATPGTPGSAVADSGTAACTGTVVPGVTPVFKVTDTDGTPDAALGPVNCGVSDNDGIATCSYTRSTTTTDSIVVYVQQSGTALTSTPNLDQAGCPATTPCEPSDTIAKNYIAAQTGNTIAVTCETNGTTVNGVVDGTAGSNNTGTGTATCGQRNTDGTRIFTATVKNTATVPVTQNGVLVRFTIGGDATPKTFECTTGVGANAGECSVLVTDATPVSGETIPVSAVIRGTSATGSASLTFTNVSGDARNVLLSPKTQTVTAGSGVPGSLTAKVTDVDGAPVPNVNVVFTEAGPGRFVSPNNGADSTVVTTNAQGVATVEITAQPTEIGDDNVNASIGNVPFTGSNECTAAAGKNAAGTAYPVGSTQAGSTAGNCTDTAVVHFVATSPTPTPSTSTTPPSGRAALTLSTSTPTIPAGSTGKYHATGAASQAYQLQCYSRPSTTYVTARSGSFDAAGTPVDFTVSLGRNTRCFIQYATNSTQGASPSVVINVRTVLSLSTVRTAVRTYIFQGRNLPRVAGQLITLYRVDSSGNEIRTSNLVTDSSGIYRVSRKFTGTGTFQFRVRTSQTLNNAAGVSNTITVSVH
jgi:hypothetical protein